VNKVKVFHLLVHPYLRETTKSSLGCAGNTMASHPRREIPVGPIILFFSIPMFRGFLPPLVSSGKFPYQLLQSPIFSIRSTVDTNDFSAL